jgi:hypothetical protein
MRSSPRWHRGEAVVVTTVAEDGTPHHAFHSEDEWARRAGGDVVLALLAESRTGRNLAAGCWATLLTLDGRGPATLLGRLKGKPRRSKADPARLLFVVAVVREIPARVLPGEKARWKGTLAYERLVEPEDSARRKFLSEEVSR